MITIRSFQVSISQKLFFTKDIKMKNNGNETNRDEEMSIIEETVQVNRIFHKNKDFLRL